MEKVYLVIRYYAYGDHDVLAVTKDPERAEELMKMFSVEEHGTISVRSIMMDTIDDPMYYEWEITFDSYGDIDDETIYEGTAMPRNKVSDYKCDESSIEICRGDKYITTHVVASTRDEAREKAREKFNECKMQEKKLKDEWPMF